MTRATAPTSLPPDSMIGIGPDGHPVVRCQANAPSTRMGMEASAQLEQAALAEEDARRAGMPG